MLWICVPHSSSIPAYYQVIPAYWQGNLWCPEYGVLLLYLLAGNLRKTSELCACQSSIVSTSHSKLPLVH